MILKGVLLLVVGYLTVSELMLWVLKRTSSFEHPKHMFEFMDAVKCRRCDNALSLDDCTRSVTCSSNEECFTDELVTEQLTIVFNAGCRARDVCKSAASSGNPVGKRSLDLSHISKRQSSGDVVACSRCCDVNVTNGVECNAKLCGIKGSTTGAQQCYFCDSEIAGGQGDVDEPTKCGSLTNCQTDEVCGSKLFALASNTTHRYTCLNKRICTLLTQKALEDVKRCKDPAVVAAGGCGNRRRSGQMLCTACCGDALCNSGTCFEVLERLYNLWDAGVLDFKTLKTNSSAIIPTSPAPATSSNPPGPTPPPGPITTT